MSERRNTADTQTICFVALARSVHFQMIKVTLVMVGLALVVSLEKAAQEEICEGLGQNAIEEAPSW